jgi:hypothetical protein
VSERYQQSAFRYQLIPKGYLDAISEITNITSADSRKLTAKRLMTAKSLKQ